MAKSSEAWRELLAEQTLGQMIFAAGSGSGGQWVAMERTVDCVLEATTPDLREYRADCSEPVARFFAHALARQPSRRPWSAREFKTGLEALRAAH